MNVTFQAQTSDVASDATPEISEPLIGRVSDCAEAFHIGNEEADWILPALAKEDLLTPGAPENTDGGLHTSMVVIRNLAEHSVSAAFTVWAHRMTAEFLAQAASDGNAYAKRILPELQSGKTPGITGMASAFRSLSGVGELDVEARQDGDDWILDGTLRWASNQYPNAQVVTAATTEDGERVIVSFPLATEGVTPGKVFQLLSLNSTRSSFIRLENVRIKAEQVIATDFDCFLKATRPTFLLLQSAMCAGLADACIQATTKCMTGMNVVFEESLNLLRERLARLDQALRETAEGVRPGGARLELEVGAIPESYTPMRLLPLRLESAELANDAAALELRCAGGRGYAASSPASRRFREAAFIPVQSPSEVQLRWELANVR